MEPCGVSVGSRALLDSVICSLQGSQQLLGKQHGASTPLLILLQPEPCVGCPGCTGDGRGLCRAVVPAPSLPRCPQHSKVPVRPQGSASRRLQPGWVCSCFISQSSIKHH